MNSVLWNGDCLELMNNIADGSVDMILCDLPYGTTACKWDIIIPFEPLWKQYERLIKDNGAIVLTASQPFTSALVMSNIKLFKYEWIWQKTMGTNPVLVKSMPFKKHENVCVFYKEGPTYNPQMELGKPYVDKRKTVRKKIGVHGDGSFTRKPIENRGYRFPGSVQLFPNPNNNNLHPTQKPVLLFEYFIKTYSNEHDTVLDNCMGSGTTGVACKNLNRNFIGIEKDKKYFDIAVKRIEETG